VNSTKLRRSGLLAAGAVSLALLALPSSSVADGDSACPLPAGSDVDRSPTFTFTDAGNLIVTPWGATAIDECTPLEVSPIGRKH
jgi:hypothetical protein